VKRQREQSMKRAFLLTMTTAACLGLAAAQGTASAPMRASERYYEVFDTGQKLGYSRVQWRPSTWRGKQSVHDTTLVVQRGVRDMSGQRDAFDTRTLLEIERSPTGRLYYQRRRIQEGGRTSIEEVTWTGSGYHVLMRVGQDGAQTRTIPSAKPVFLDAEAFLSLRAQAGTLARGAKLSFKCLDTRTRRVVEVPLLVLGPETIQGAGGPVDCVRVRERDPRSGTSTTYWLDRQGAFVRLSDDQGNRTQHAGAIKAMRMPDRPATFSITVPSEPPLPRVFNADALAVTIHLAPAPHRAMPEFPASPWSKVLGVVGNQQTGFVVCARLTAYDRSTPPTKLPADPKAFASDLESTPLMPVKDPRLTREARRVIGETTDMRTAAYKLARHVHNTLAKQSPAVASTTALEILRERKGDCSEHCVLFVALCRSVGIPARRASGFVNIGSNWGAHDWAEIWVGKWIGADPTTGEVGTKARYLFFGYPDLPDSYPERVRAQSSGRLQIRVTELVEGVRKVAFEARKLVESKGSNHHQLATGVEIRDLPKGWRVRMAPTGNVHVFGGSLRADIRAIADQGDDLSKLFGQVSGNYSGRRAWVQEWGGGARIWVHARRRFIELSIRGGTPEERQQLEKCLSPTFSRTKR
jgi:transglutaminase-like putative cysteine protease